MPLQGHLVLVRLCLLKVLVEQTLDGEAWEGAIQSVKKFSAIQGNLHRPNHKLAIRPEKRQINIQAFGVQLLGLATLEDPSQLHPTSGSAHPRVMKARTAPFPEIPRFRPPFEVYQAAVEGGQPPLCSRTTHETSRMTKNTSMKGVGTCRRCPGRSGTLLIEVVSLRSRVTCRGSYDAWTRVLRAINAGGSE